MTPDAPAPAPAPSEGSTAGLSGLGRVHLVGIGGAGMSGIARILLARRTAVSGSDAKESATLAALRALGAEVHVGHRAEHVEGADTVVVSTAIRETNPELARARELGLRVLPRAAALAAVMAGSRGVCVAGTHGKTTTTSMATVALQACGVDPSFAIGGDLNEAGSNAHAGSGDLFVAESDESDGSFLLLSPYAAVVTNVEADHLDHYGDAAAVDRAFEEFVARVHPDGLLVACADDAGSRRVAAVGRARGLRVLTYGTADDADVRATGITFAGATASFTPVGQGLPGRPVTLAVPGAHNVLNACAALTVGVALGLPAERLSAGLAIYRGVRRRFELKGTAGGVRVFDDYAHHPTEIEATLRAAREVVGEGRLVVAFQPHRYSRTLAFAAEFGQSLALADEVVVLDVYAAGEDPIPGATGAAVAAAVPLPADRVAHERSFTAVPAELVRRARPGDLVLTLGAGDVTMLGREVLALLEAGAP